MASLDNCFVDTVAVPLQLIDVGAPFRAAEEGREPASQSYHIRFSGLPELASHLETVKQTDYTCRYISICQRTSWRPLQATKPMLDLIVSQHDIGPSFWEIPSCFYTRNLELEQVHCVPYTESRRGPFIEISYTLKYPEYKPNDDKWVVRQSGVYHRFNTVTSQSTYVLFSPTPNSKAHQRAEEYLLGHRDDAEAEPFWLHRILFSTYYPAWRQHIAALESQFLPIANKTFATFIDKPLGIGYDNLSELISLEKQFLQMPIILASSIDSLRELDVLVGSLPAAPASRDTVCELRNLHRQSVSFSRMATHLQQRAQITAQLLSDTLSLRDQGVAKQQNENMLRLNKSAVFITTLTLLYLPASFVASFFGSNFWALDTDSGTIVGTPMIWIFVISSASLTALTFIFYYWLLQRDGSVFRRLQPKISMRIPPDWNFKGLTRRFTNAKDGDNLFEMSKA